MPSTAVTLVIFVLAPLFVSVRPIEHGVEMLQLVKVIVMLASVVVAFKANKTLFSCCTCIALIVKQ